MSQKPANIFSYLRPDEVAECWNGVIKDGDFSLYDALWNALDGAPALGDVIDIENSGPDDAIGINSVASLWGKFSEDQQARLNQIAAAQS